MVFFFQAEDGIRDGHVTGVQTCALPISELPGDIRLSGNGRRSLRRPLSGGRQSSRTGMAPGCGRAFGQDARSDWMAGSCFARSLACCDRGLVRHERSDLVDSIWDLLVRCLAGAPSPFGEGSVFVGAESLYDQFGIKGAPLVF